MAIETVDDFLGHTNMDSSRAGFLKKWKDSPGYIDLWLSAIGLPQAKWTHGGHKIEVRENRDTKRVSKEVWSDDFNCWEPESVLRRQYRRDDEGQREEFPCLCPDCRFIEAMYQIVNFGKLVDPTSGKTIAKGKLSWVEPVLTYEGSDDRRNITVHAAGLFNGYKDVEKDTDEMEELRAAGIYLGGKDGAWRENMLAKLSYVFRIISNSEPAKGVQVTTEPGLLGDKVKRLIAQTREDMGEEEGNPFLHPYAMRWKFMKDEPFDKKYEAMRMSKLELTESIRKLIHGPAPAIDFMLKRGDAKILRSRMEKHMTDAAKKVIPLDWIFEPSDNAAEEPDEKPARKPATRRQEASPEPEAPKAAEPVPPARKGRQRVRETPPAPPPEPEVEMSPCDDCGKPIPLDATVCKHCGAKYAVTHDEPAPKPAAKAAPKASEDFVPAKQPNPRQALIDNLDDEEIPF